MIYQALQFIGVKSYSAHRVMYLSSRESFKNVAKTVNLNTS